jgi:hypothetical protein
MKIFGPRTVYGYPQFSKKFEWRLIIGCALVVIVCTLLVWPAMSNDSSRDYYSNRGWSGTDTTGKQTGTKSGFRRGVSGLLRFFTTGKGDLTTFTPYSNTGTADGIISGGDRWAVGVLNFRSGAQERAIIDTVQHSFAPIGSTGRLIGPV